MAEHERPPSLEELDTRLRAARARELTEQAGRGSRDRRLTGLGLGLRLTVEIVVGFGVGGALGRGLDVWLGTNPWLMVLCLLLGAAAGLMNAYRMAKGLDGTVGLAAAMKRRAERDKG